MLVDNEIVIGARGRGLMCAVDLANEHVGEEVYDELIEKGFIVCNRGSLFRIDPPLTISEAEFVPFLPHGRPKLQSYLLQRPVSSGLSPLQ